MRSKKVNSQTFTTTVVDKETGEIISETYDTRHLKIVVDDNESFFLVFASAVSALSDKALSGLDENLLRWICSRSVYNMNRVGLQKNVKEEFAKQAGVKLQSVSNSIHKLKTCGIIVPEGNGNYMINPNFFWRGDRKERLNKYDLFMSIYKK